MRLVTFEASGKHRPGALIDNDRRIVDFTTAIGEGEAHFHSMQALIEGGVDPVLISTASLVFAGGLGSASLTPSPGCAR